MTRYIIDLTIGLAWAVTVGWVLWAGRRRRAAASKGGKEAVEQIADTLSAAAGIAVDMQAQRDETERQRRRADEYFGKIESVVTEAREMTALYLRTGAEHAAAQDMMMREIERLCLQYAALQKQVWAAETLETAKQAAKSPLRRNATLKVIADEFRDKHVIQPSELAKALSEGKHPTAALVELAKLLTTRPASTDSTAG